MTRTQKHMDTIVDVPLLNQSWFIFRALRHTLRQRMLKLIDEHNRITVKDLVAAIQVEQSVTSSHLAILRRAGLVTATNQGRFVYYSINYPKLKEVQSKLTEMVNLA